jgi:hypothetical protein
MYRLALQRSNILMRYNDLRQRTGRGSGPQNCPNRRKSRRVPLGHPNQFPIRHDAMTIPRTGFAATNRCSGSRNEGELPSSPTPCRTSTLTLGHAPAKILMDQKLDGP